MKKLVSIAIFLILTGTSVFASDYKPFRFQAVIMPALSFSDDYVGGIGGRLEFGYRLLPNLCLGVSVGALGLFPTDDWMDRYGYDYRNQSCTHIPVLVNAAWLILTGSFRPFIAVGIGLVHTQEHYEYYYDPYGWRNVDADNDYLALEPSAGVEMDIGEQLMLSASLRYLVIVDRSDCFCASFGIGLRF